MEPKNFIFEHGKGCSGKDTQAHLIHEHFGEKAVELSTGDIFRGAITGQGEYGRFKSVLDPYIEEVNKRGGYISDEPIVEIVKTIVQEQIENGVETFIFTGFPRTTVQLDLVDSMLAELQAIGTHVLLDVSDDTVRERARVRREYDVQNGKKPREDDQPEQVELRLDTYLKKTYPMVLRLDQEGRLIRIDGEETINEVNSEIMRGVSKERQ